MLSNNAPDFAFLINVNAVSELSNIIFDKGAYYKALALLLSKKF